MGADFALTHNHTHIVIRKHGTADVLHKREAFEESKTFLCRTFLPLPLSLSRATPLSQEHTVSRCKDQGGAAPLQRKVRVTDRVVSAWILVAQSRHLCILQTERTSKCSVDMGTARSVSKLAHRHIQVVAPLEAALFRRLEPSEAMA